LPQTFGACCGQECPRAGPCGLAVPGDTRALPSINDFQVRGPGSFSHGRGWTNRTEPVTLLPACRPVSGLMGNA
jgi:hypothetical protein